MLYNYIDIIKDVEFFRGIENNNILCILDCFNARINQYKKNTCIVKQGEYFHYVGIILEGEVKVIKENATGNRIFIGRYGPKQAIGQMILFSSNPYWHYTLQTEKDTTVLLLVKDKIVGTCQENCANIDVFKNNLLNIISNTFMDFQKQLEFTTIKGVKEKISTFLLYKYNETQKKYMEIEFNRNELADYLNVSRPTLSRELAKMKEDGIIDFYMDTFKIKDIEKLKEIAEGNK